MTKSLLIYFVILSSTSSALAQKGYMDHKNYFDFSAFGNVPLASGSFNQTEFKPSGDKMIKSRDWLDYGASFSYYRAMSKSFSMGLMSSFKHYELSLPSNYTSIYSSQHNSSVDTTLIRFESLRYRNYYFGPTFEFASKNGSSGIGFTYDLSVGASISVFRDGAYGYSLNEFSLSDNDENWTNLDYYETGFDWKSIYGVFLQTGFKIRYPFSDFMSFYTGFRYTLLVNYKPKSFIDNADKNIFNAEDVYFQIQRENFFTTTLDFGLTFYL
ncbi:MAG: hypothetical protein COA32_00195 [Fluviicola sp.]|nr:MAG: hypothetical protein COA32_00195 [Fluviicola sp.]